MEKDINKIIQASFLSEADKQILLELYKAEGESDAFYNEFNRLLIKETEKRKQRYLMISNELDVAISALEKKDGQIRKTLAEKLKLQMSQVEIENLDEREQAIEKYYSDLRQHQQDQEDKVKQIGAQLLLSAND